MKRSLLLILSLTILPLATGQRHTAAGSSVIAERLTLAGGSLAGRETSELAVDGGGLTLAPEATAARFLSPILEAPVSFNVLVPAWTADVPPGASLELAVRTGRATIPSVRWSEWMPLVESADLTVAESGAATGDFLAVPADDVVHDRAQLRVSLSRSAGAAAPRLEEMDLLFIDSTKGPTAAELVGRQQALSSQEAAEDDSGSYPRPFVVSREVWCTDPACDYNEGLEYHPVSHLIAHHTVTSNSSGDWAATVRAIWYFHAFERGWGDIGYNYLVDGNGLLYEGHLGGDDVIGTHAAGANAGSMALAFIGNFNERTPAAAPFNAAADLFAWKADQKGIDVYDASRLPYVDWGLPHLMGHRDVYGTTECPGHQLHALLPTLRDTVANRIDFSPPHLYFDEEDPATRFNRSPINWWDGPNGCGFDGHAFYTWSVTDPGESTNWATWEPLLSAPGRYELSVYAPYCRTGEGDTEGALYEVSHAHGTEQVFVNQEENLGLWSSLGDYDFKAIGSRLRLTDLTSTDSDQGMWFDAIRFLYRQPELFPVAPAEGEWLSDPPFTFTWNLDNEASLTGQKLEVAQDELFGQPLMEKTLPTTTTLATGSFAVEDGPLFWRVRLYNTRGETITPPAVAALVDREPPTSQIDAIFKLNDGRYFIAWHGADAGSGVVGYNIDYRSALTTTWTRWLTETAATAAFFAPPTPGTVFWFRSQAIDGVGQEEGIGGSDGDLSTEAALPLTTRLFLPVLTQD